MKKLLKPPVFAAIAKNSLSMHSTSATAIGAAAAGQVPGAHDNR